jgi:flagellar protein FlaG
MSTTAPISGIFPDPTPSTSTTSSSVAAGASQVPPTPIDDQADLRLVIEDDKAAGSYVYKTINPVTGEVILQIPREELLKMREAADYKPGSVIIATG